MHRQHVTDDFKLGMVNALPDTAIKDGAASDSLGWLCKESEIELSGGSVQIGSDAVSGTTDNYFSVTRQDGVKVAWKKVGTKLYSITEGGAWAEVGSDLFAGASDDVPSFALWSGFTGQWVFFSSPHSALWKVNPANPSSVIKFTSAGYRGQLFVAKSRLWVYNWLTSGGALDVSGITGSYLPSSDIGNAQYTTTSGEAYGTGDGVTVTFAHTLTNITGTRNAFAVSVTCGSETFTEDGAGNLTSNLGGTGTVNYATGAVSVTFAAAPANLAAITCKYTREDSGASGGLAYFTTFSTAAGDGKAHYLPQPKGGAMRSAWEFSDALYCVHERAVWRVTFDAYGDPSSNLVFRDGSGCSSLLGSVATSDGIFFADDSDGDRPNVRVVTLDAKNSAQVICPSVSDGRLDLTGWTLGAMGASGDRVLVAATDPDGDRCTLVLERRLSSWTRQPYAADCYDQWGELAAYGSSGLAFTAFDGTDADGFTPSNGWASGASSLGYDGLKRVRGLWLEGNIAAAQSFRVEVANDGGDWTELGTLSGDGSYVVASDAGTVGGSEVGTMAVGDPGSDGTAYFRASLPYTPDRFATSKVRVTALGAGNLRIRKFTHNGVRWYGRRLPRGFRGE